MPEFLSTQEGAKADGLVFDFICFHSVDVVKSDGDASAGVFLTTQS